MDLYNDDLQEGMFGFVTSYRVVEWSYGPSWRLQTAPIPFKISIPIDLVGGYKVLLSKRSPENRCSHTTASKLGKNRELLAKWDRCIEPLTNDTLG